jgi:hypothetical protein
MGERSEEKFIQTYENYEVAYRENIYQPDFYQSNNYIDDKGNFIYKLVRILCKKELIHLVYNK